MIAEIETRHHGDVRFHIGFKPDMLELNQQIISAYQDLQAQDFRKRSHYFGGRYENLYLQHGRISAIERVMQQATEFAAKLLRRNADSLRSGFWINDMGPGDATSAHDHDEDDELLSGVYYVKVPANSGNLLIHDACSTAEVKPQAGMFVFFSPDVVHSVSTNLSAARRISIGMNFGPA